MPKSQQTEKLKTDQQDIIQTKPNTDLKISFAFSLSDADGEVFRLGDTLTFKSALEPGMIGSINKRISNTLGQVGQEYFLELLRDYLSKKQEAILASQSLEIYKRSQIENSDDKYIASGVTNVIGEGYDDKDTEPPIAADELEVES